MKINIEIDLTDLYADEDNTEVNQIILDTIDQEIKRRIHLELKASIDTAVVKAVDKVLKETVTKEVKTSIEEKIHSRLETVKISEPYNENKLTTVNDYIIKEISGHINSSMHKALKTKVDNTTSNAIKNLQNQYNDNFASAFITKLKEGNFLSDKASSILLAEKAPPVI